MQIKNSENSFGIIAITFHWVMAILLIALLGEGLYMVGLPLSLETIKLFGWHKEWGMVALFLVILRLYWRISNITPLLSIPYLEKIAARSAHWAFYGFMFTLPISGWLLTSAAGFPVSLFGLVVLPNLISPNPDHLRLLEEIHKWLGYGLIATICVHTAAALKHHFINKDDILRRMLS